MQRGFWTKFVSVVALTLGSVWLLYPTYVYYWKASPEARADNKVFCASLPSWETCHKMTLGLDLQGGLHLVMGVVVDKAVSDRAERLTDSLKDRLKDKDIAFEKATHPDDTADIVLNLTDTNGEAKVRQLLRDEFSVMEVKDRIDGGKTLRLSIIKDEQTRLKADAVDQAIKTIRNRADKYGVSEPSIAKRGQDNILIELPGVKDPNRAIEIIGKTAQLEFIMVDDEIKPLETIELPAGVTRDFDSVRKPDGSQGRAAFLRAKTKEEIFDATKGKIPEDHAIKVEEERDGDGKLSGFRSWLVFKKAGITGDYLTNASVSLDREKGGHYVAFSFDPEGAKIFGKLTGDNVGHRMAIVLDDIVNSAPVIQSKIGGGNGSITLGGYKTAQEILEDAKNLVLVLKSGALAAPVVVREQRTVGATLGGEAVKKGETAMAIGLLLVVLWMAIYYKWSGVIANVALIFNFVFLVALLAGLEATLTLPGMAGIALTLGMAVDANVIILERIREELRHGKTVRAAVDSGYDKAFWTIFDSHVTAIVSGVILYQYGSGPVRGFATTLIIGITASLYTSVVITKMIYQYLMSRTKMETISI